MADVRPFPALHYELSIAGSLGNVTAPPYDVIGSEERAELLARSPFNVVEIDLPQGGEESDPYAHAADTLEDWRLQGILRQDREPTLWALTQEYAVGDDQRRTRHAILARVRLEEYESGVIRPHERTQPAPKQDRLDLTRATRHNLSPIFALSSANAWPQIESATSGEPWGEVEDPEGTVHRVWRVAEPEIHSAVSAALADAELLIADGHHRYETALTYAREIEGDGLHRFTLMALTGLDDPGLTVLPTHRLVGGLDDERAGRLREGLRELFESEEVSAEEVDPANEEGVGVFGLIDRGGDRSARLRLKDTAKLDRLLEGRPEPYRRVDAVILEALVLRGILGMSDEEIQAKRDLAYVQSVPAADALLDQGTYQTAFILRPPPVEQVRAVAAAGETMPPKSTFFFPKLLSGIVFNPLS